MQLNDQPQLEDYEGLGVGSKQITALYTAHIHEQRSKK